MYEIEKTKELPVREGIGLTGYLRSLKPGEHFVCPKKFQNRMSVLARQIGIKVITKKDGPDHITVWRAE